MSEKMPLIEKSVYLCDYTQEELEHLELIQRQDALTKQRQNAADRLVLEAKKKEWAGKLKANANITSIMDDEAQVALFDAIWFINFIKQLEA